MKQPKLLKSYLEEGRRYFALSVKDLLEARDNYHVFLSRKTNVIGTAIGKARIRKPGVPKSVEKTLENSEVQPYSWPCVLVFVKEWLFQPDLAKGSKLHKELLPERLYLSDGREIPVCVVKAAWQPRSTEKPTPSMKFPGNIIGGGYPIMTKVQGVEHWATLGCLVTDGRMTYGLTSAHVTGRPGESLFTLKNGNEVEIGVSSEKQLRKEAFSSMYPEFPGRHSILNLDLGLIEFHDLTGVSSQIFGLREVTGLADVNHDTLCLGLIGCRVEGYGCASGEMKGEIAGLFYRYASKGGYDFVADYLVGPRHEANAKQVRAFAPAYGDSGTLLVIDAPGSKEDRKALGVLWGGQRDETGKCEQPYGLVSNLGTICQKLDVELVHDWNVGYDRYFGAYAHFVLPSLCPDVIKDETLKDLMRKNISAFSLPLDRTAPAQTGGFSKKEFVPLADVPDLVWKLRGGRFNRGGEGPNHFADLDEPNSNDHNETLLQLCDDHKYIEPEEWLKYYKAVKADQKGSLPFRIAQIYDTMKTAAKDGDRDRFVCAAGILTHYVFDACMPLHISYMYNGDPNGEKKTIVENHKEKQVPLAHGIHELFDNQLMEKHATALQQKLPTLVREKAQKNLPVAASAIKSSKDAAVAAVALMRDTVNYLDPICIVKYYEQLLKDGDSDPSGQLWTKFGSKYLEAVAEGVVLNARLWEAAWREGKGAKKIKPAGVRPEDLSALYLTKTGFLDSVKLENIRSTMQWP